MSTRRLRIVGIGDSTTAGTPAFMSPLEAPPSGRGDARSQYAFWMRELHPEWEVLNCGVNRERTDQILDRVPRDVVRNQPEYAIVLAGVNDVYQGRPLGAVQANLDSTYSAVRACGAGLVAASILPFNTSSPGHQAALVQLNQWIRSRAAGLGSLFCDTAVLAADARDPARLAGSPDGLHPDVATYRAIGVGLARLIERAELGKASSPSGQGEPP